MPKLKTFRQIVAGPVVFAITLNVAAPLTCASPISQGIPATASANFDKETLSLRSPFAPHFLLREEARMWQRILDIFETVFRRGVPSGQGTTFRASFRLFKADYRSTAHIERREGRSLFFINEDWIKTLIRLQSQLGSAVRFGPVDLIDSIIYAVAIHEMGHHWGPTMKPPVADVFDLRFTSLHDEARLQAFRGGATFNGVNLAAYRFYLRYAGIPTHFLDISLFRLSGETGGDFLHWSRRIAARAGKFLPSQLGTAFLYGESKRAQTVGSEVINGSSEQNDLFWGTRQLTDKEIEQLQHLQKHFDRARERLIAAAAIFPGIPQRGGYGFLFGWRRDRLFLWIHHSKLDLEGPELNRQMRIKVVKRLAKTELRSPESDLLTTELLRTFFNIVDEAVAARRAYYRGLQPYTLFEQRFIEPAENEAMGDFGRLKEALLTHPIGPNHLFARWVDLHRKYAMGDIRYDPIQDEFILEILRSVVGNIAELETDLKRSPDESVRRYRLLSALKPLILYSHQMPPYMRRQFRWALAEYFFQVEIPFDVMAIGDIPSEVFFKRLVPSVSLGRMSLAERLLRSGQPDTIENWESIYNSVVRKKGISRLLSSLSEVWDDMIGQLSPATIRTHRALARGRYKNIDASNLENLTLGIVKPFQALNLLLALSAAGRISLQDRPGDSDLKILETAVERMRGLVEEISKIIYEGPEDYSARSEGPLRAAA